ncbi:AlpA family phage regulatory protein [Psychrobacter fjordensis]|uniref:AlpA family phage regulatory protein n=1 Tax=Psychrobacter fjordensis TaxID=664424 RepID=UPI001918FF22|nr:AlpA family phage regulatory protein [Psychrobacter fjordensis]
MGLLDSIFHFIFYSLVFHGSLSMINKSSDRCDQTFPKEIQLTQVGVMWITSEIAECINISIVERSS